MAKNKPEMPSKSGSPDTAIAQPGVEGDEFSLLKTIVRAFKVASVAAAVWVWGYLDFSVAWVYVGLFFYVAGEEVRKIKDSKKAYAKHALRSEQEAILSRVDEKPSWVHFRDVEKAEWFNKVLKQMWPYIGEYVHNLLLTSIQPTIQNSLPEKISDFRFETIDMGDQPARIDGVKVYMEQVKKDEIICDIEFRYTGDAKFKVSLDGVGAGIKSLNVAGNMRVIMKPLIDDIPFVGGLCVFFLNRPSVNFDLTAVANLLDMPFLNKSLRSIVEDQIANYLVLPNRLPIQMAEGIDLHKLKHPVPQGVVHLQVLEGHDLKAADGKLVGKRTSDPYCIIKVGANVFKTKAVKSSLNPTWDHHFEIIIDQKFGQRIDIEVRDADISNDEFLGGTSLSVETVLKSGTVDLWQQLEGTTTGSIHVRLAFLHLCKDIQEMRQRRSMVIKVPVNGSQILSSAVLILFLDEAFNFPKPRNIYAVMTVGLKSIKSNVQQKTTNPVWGNNFQFLLDDPETQVATIELWSIGPKKKLGIVHIPLNLVLAKDHLSVVLTRPIVAASEPLPDCKLTVRITLRMLSSELPPDWYTDSVQSMSSSRGFQPSVSESNLSSASASEIVMDGESLVAASTAELVGAAPSHGHSGDKDFGQIRLTIQYVEHLSHLEVTVHECRNLIPCDKDNLADPYVRLYMMPDHSKASKRKTRTVKNDLNPTFEEKFEWPMSIADVGVRALDIVVKNDVSMFSRSRSSMGRVVIGLSTVRNITYPTIAWYDLSEANVS